MISIPRFRACVLGTLPVALTLAVATGCQSHSAVPGLQGHRIVARLNNEAVTDDSYVDRMEHATVSDYQQIQQTAGRQDPSMDAGTVALISLLRDDAIAQLAQQMKVVPSDDEIDAYYSYQLKRNPALSTAIQSGQVSEADVKRSIRLQLEEMEVGTDGAQADDKELQTAFAAQKPQLDIPETIGLRMLRVKDETDGVLVLNKLKASGDFKQAALDEHDVPPLNGQENMIPVTQLRDSPQPQAKALWNAISSLNAGQFAKDPVNLSPSATPGSPQLWVIAQVTRRVPGQSVTLAQVRPIIVENVLAQRFPEYQVHFLQKLTDFLQSAKESNKIEIYIDRYKPIVVAYLTAPPVLPSGGVGAPSGAGSGPGSSPGRSGSAGPGGGTP